MGIFDPEERKENQLFWSLSAVQKQPFTYVSRNRCILEKDFAIFTGKHPCWSLLIKLQAFRLLQWLVLAVSHSIKA